MYDIISKNNLWIAISGVLMAASIVCLAIWGLRLGIDFTGGSLLEVRYNENRPSVTQIEDKLKDLNLSSLSVRPAGDDHVVLRFQETNEETHQTVLARLNELSTGEDANFEELRFEAVGPSIGQELQRRAISMIIIVLLTISLYIAWAFRKVSRPVTSWRYGVATIVSLVHDVLIVLGFFAYLGHFHNVEINTAFVAAVLTVLGFSVHDTIVVFDRLRENLPRSNDSFPATVNTSLNQTITRSINTSLTVMLVLAAIVLLGGSSIYHFALALLIGIFFGTYSSIFLASPILVLFYRLSQRRAS